MKVRFFTVLATALLLTVNAYSQTAVEYGAIATSASKVLAAPGTARAIAPPTVPDTASHKASGTYVGGKHGVKVWQEKGARTKDVAPSKPAPSAVFILSNGERLESGDYVMTADSLRLDQNGTSRTIPLSTLNVNATVAANRERGLDLKIPDSKGQMTISW
jgi:hypothetical protein